MKLGQVILAPRLFAMLLFFPLGSHAASTPIRDEAQSLPQASDPLGLVRQATINYKARQSKWGDYVYVEHSLTRWSHIPPVSDSYEVIPLGGGLYRRHVLHNKLPLPEEDEKQEQEKLAAAIRQSANDLVKIRAPSGGISKQGGMPMSRADTPVDPQLAEIQSGTGEARKQIDAVVTRIGRDAPMYTGMEWFKRRLRDLQLPLEDLTDSFDLRLRGTEILDSRQVYVIEATPKSRHEEPRNQDDAQNFAVTLWIDTAETEFVKVEGRALKAGLLSAKPEYAVFDSQNYSKEAVANARNAVYEGSLEYSAGTTITSEWVKVNGEAWLPKRRYIKGKEIWTFPTMSPTGNKGKTSGAFPVEHEETYSGYRKFHVDTRIVPASSQQP